MNLSQQAREKLNMNLPLMSIAFELSDKKWKLQFEHRGRVRVVDLRAGDLQLLDEAIDAALKKIGLDRNCQIVTCYEAGRDAFWIHRCLTARGFVSLIIDSSSIEVPRRHRRKKTDRVDVGKLSALLKRWLGGEEGMWSLVHPPSEEDEDERRPHRELERLKKERTAHVNRLKSLLVAQGARLGGEKFEEARPEVTPEFLEDLNRTRDWSGKELGSYLITELTREFQRWKLVAEQIVALEKEQLQRIKKQADKAASQAASLMELKGVGPVCATILAYEFFGWREFENRRQVASLAGLAPTPYASGDSEREQGISKAGNRRVRRIMIEISWLWLRYQPNSEITLWFNERFSGGKRGRRIGIVGVARRLLVDFWRYLDRGVVPEGAVFKKA